MVTTFPLDASPAFDGDTLLIVALVCAVVALATNMAAMLWLVAGRSRSSARDRGPEGWTVIDGDPPTVTIAPALPSRLG